MKTRYLALCIIVFGLGGCATVRHGGGVNYPTDEVEARGANTVVGGLLGVAAGAALGAAVGDPGTGALIGATAGAALGVTAPVHEDRRSYYRYQYVPPPVYYVPEDYWQHRHHHYYMPPSVYYVPRRHHHHGGYYRFSAPRPPIIPQGRRPQY